MNLIIILITLVLEKYLDDLEQFRKFDWFTRFTAWMHARVSPAFDGMAGALLCVVPAGLLAAIIAALLNPFLGMLFSVAVLSYSLGPMNLLAQSDRFLDALRRDDREGAVSQSAEIQGAAPLSGDEPLVLKTSQAILVQANERYFAVLFWFLILGPMGALLFRLTSLLRSLAGNYQKDHPGFSRAAQRLHFVLNWLPARATVIGYALSGSLVDTMNNWRRFHAHEAAKWDDRNAGLIACCGMGALQLETERQCDIEEDPDEIRFAVSLALRALIIGVSIVAIMTIAGWAN